MFDHIHKSLYTSKSKTSLEDEVLKAFKTLDKDHDGKIDLDEFKQVVNVYPSILSFFQPMQELREKQEKVEREVSKSSATSSRSNHQRRKDSESLSERQPLLDETRRRRKKAFEDNLCTCGSLSCVLM